jgi:dTDP-4-dehydrorhamnose 3,5-epimerase
MKFTPTAIDGAWLVDLEPRTDERGSFARAFCLRELATHGLELQVVQCNLARTARAGVVRGLHYQLAPAEEKKLVRCVAGAILDVLIDMREDSPTYRAVVAAQLDAATGRAIFVPSGVAHGYQTLVDDVDVFYMTDQYYAPGMERGVRYSDPALGIQWPQEAHGVAPRDREWPLLS